MPEKQPDIIEGLFPTRRVHLIAGPAGVGKTTLIDQMVDAVVHDRDFLGMKTRKVPVVYVAADRTAEEFAETADRLKLDIVGKVKLVDMESYKAMPLLIEILDQHAAKGSLVVVEPLQMFVTNALNQTGNANDSVQVARFLTIIRRMAAHGNFTILGSCHSPKSKEGNDYLMARERIAGSYAWGAFTSTDILVEQEDKKDAESPYRKVVFLFRNRKPKVMQFRLDDETGVYVPCQEGKSKNWEGLDKELTTWPFEEPLPVSQIIEWAQLVDCSKATTKRWIQGKIEDGILERIGHGVYKKLHSN